MHEVGVDEVGLLAPGDASDGACEAEVEVAGAGEPVVGDARRCQLDVERIGCERRVVEAEEAGVDAELAQGR